MKNKSRKTRLNQPRGYTISTEMTIYIYINTLPKRLLVRRRFHIYEYALTVRLRIIKI